MNMFENALSRNVKESDQLPEQVGSSLTQTTSFKKLHVNLSGSFCAMLLTDKQTYSKTQKTTTLFVYCDV